MSDLTKHVVEANHVRRVRLLSGEPIADDVIVLGSDVFGYDDDLPSTDEVVTVASGSEVIRGKVTAIVFLVEVAP